MVRSIELSYRTRRQLQDMHFDVSCEFHDAMKLEDRRGAAMLDHVMAEIEAALEDNNDE